MFINTSVIIIRAVIGSMVEHLFFFCFRIANHSTRFVVFSNMYYRKTTNPFYMNFLYHLSFVVIFFFNILYALYIKLSENVTISWCIEKYFSLIKNSEVLI